MSFAVLWNKLGKYMKRQLEISKYSKIFFFLMEIKGGKIEWKINNIFMKKWHWICPWKYKKWRRGRGVYF